MPSLLVLLFLSLSLNASPSDQARDNEAKMIEAYSERMKKFYELPEGATWKDVTAEVLDSPDTSPESKESIRAYKRRIIVFAYPSDGLSVKGFLSFTPSQSGQPLLVLYRWGNGEFALMNPGVVLATYKNFTVLSSTLRGGISEGVDEFGGKDVDDMKNLIDYLPTLGKELGVTFQPHCLFMLGPSRGGMEMFLTLSRFPELQKRVNKMVALSGILDLHQLLRDRPQDMKEMLQNQFGLPAGSGEKAWVEKRDPLKAVTKLNNTVPVLVIQGAQDNRISLQEGYNMVDALKSKGHPVDYWEFPQGNHAMTNNPLIMQQIAHWLGTCSSKTE